MGSLATSSGLSLILSLLFGTIVCALTGRAYALGRISGPHWWPDATSLGSTPLSRVISVLAVAPICLSAYSAQFNVHPTVWVSHAMLWDTCALRRKLAQLTPVASVWH